MKVKRLGGGFGGKETRCIQLSTILALAAQKTGKPVRCMLTREEDMVTSGQRHPFLGRWKIGVNKDGKIQALDLDIFNNGGWSWDLSAAVCERAMTHSDNCYKIPNVHVRGRICKTNTMSNTAFRGFGGPQGLFIAESYMSETADRLGIPVEKFREINMYKAEETTHFNQALTDWHVPLMWDQVLEETEYEKRREAIAKFNDEHKWRKRGLVSLMLKPNVDDIVMLTKDRPSSPQSSASLSQPCGSTKPALSSISTMMALSLLPMEAQRWVRACTPR